MKIYIVNGYPGSGKTTFENLVKKIHKENYCFILSTIDPIKDAARVLGWTDDKTSKGRAFLSDLKTLANKYNDTSFNYIKNEIRLIKEDFNFWEIPDNEVIIFVDCREPEEIERYRNEFDAKTILIINDKIKKDKFSNESDKNVENYHRYDIKIFNNYTLLELELSAKAFLDRELNTY